MIKIFKKFLSNSDKENIKLIRKSKYFDEKYYKLECPKAKGDLCKHYYYYGWKEGKSPSFDFSNNFYLKNYKDVEDAGINPLLHYLKFGKNENRIIEKDNGSTLKKVYEKINGCPYFYKTYIHDTDIKRINILFDHIDNNTKKISDLIKFIIEFCKCEQYQLRIIYLTADFEVLKNILKNEKIELPLNTIFLNLKSSNYLEVGLNEKYVCTNWKTARALLNTSSINTNIYYYLPQNIDKLAKEEYYQISNICTNNNVITIAKSKKDIDLIKKCQLKFSIGKQKFHLKDINQMYCDFDNMFIVGVELLNEAFLERILESESWRINLLEEKKEFKFHFDTKVSLRKVTQIEDNADLVFYMYYNKKEINCDKPYINAWVEEKDIRLKNYIIITEDNDFTKMFRNEKFSISTIDNYYDEFKNYILKLKDKR